MAKNTLKALAGLKYGQTLTEDQAATVVAEWQKALRKAGAAGRQMIARVILAAALVACAAVLAAFGGFLALNGDATVAAALVSVSLGGVFAGGMFVGR